MNVWGKRYKNFFRRYPQLGKIVFEKIKNVLKFWFIR